jgi:hypothetical protein
MGEGAHVNGIKKGFTTEARSTPRKAFSFAPLFSGTNEKVLS